MSRLARIAAQATLYGLDIIPVAVGTKRPLVPWKEFQQRLPTREELEGWIASFPDADGAFITGAVAGRIVIDCDSADAVEYLELRGIPETQLVRTREQRLHYHLAHPGFRVRNLVGELYDGIDIRGDGALAMAPGSTGKTGYTLHWEPGHSPGDVELATAPNWLMEWLLEQHRRRGVVHQAVEPRPFDGKVGAWARRVIDDELGKLAAAANGTRNVTLVRVSFKLGQLAGGGEADAGDLQAALREIADQWPEERDKSADTVMRAFTEGMAHPRRRPLRNVVWVEQQEARP